VGDCLDLGDAELPYAPLVAALRGLGRERDPAALDRILGSARDVLAPLVPELVAAATDSATAGHHRLFEALLGVLGRLGEEAPLVLAVEDLHWADRSTRDFLSFLVRNARDERLAVVGTYRSDEVHRRHPLRPFLVEVERAPGVVRLELPRFTHDELAAQAAGILGAEPDRELIDELFARGEGNAFFTEELVAARESAQRLPDSLRDALMLRVEALPPDAQQVLRAAAVAGPQVGHGLLAAAADLPERELLDALREAVAHNLLVNDPATGAYRFRHALVREALEDDLLPGERAPLHARLAAALERDASLSVSSTSAAAELAFHWSMSHNVPAAFAASVRAAEEAERLPAYAEANAHYERALELLPRVPAEQRDAALSEAALLQRAAGAAHHAGDFDRAIALARQGIALVERDGDKTSAAHLHAQLGRSLWVSGQSLAALETLRTAAAQLPGDAPPADRARVLGALGHLLMLMLRGRDARETLEEALALAIEAGATLERARILISLGSAVIESAEPEVSIGYLHEGRRLASEVGALDEVLRSHVNLGDALDLTGRLDDAIADGLEGWRLATRERMTVDAALLAGEAVLRLLRAGRWDEAADVVAHATGAGITGVTGGALLHAAAELAALRGDADTARRQLDQARRLLAGAVGPMWTAPLAVTTMLAALWQGRPEEARATAERELARDDADADGFAYLAPVFSIGARAEADLAVAARALGDDAAEREAVGRAAAYADRVRSLARETTPRGDVVGHLAACACEAARAAGEATPDDWAEVAATWEALPRPFEAAYARWREAAAALDAAGGRARAEAPLRAAAEVARRVGARPLLDEVEALARRARIGLASPAGDGPVAEREDASPSPAQQVGLTPRELEVLQLVAAGLTNREIGEQLYMSEKTASVHISRILAKLDARGRVEAAGLAHRLGLLDERVG
jgi:DNA-binding CsgD family transcriptional regulator